jgi:hypothetical protein
MLEPSADTDLLNQWSQDHHRTTLQREKDSATVKRCVERVSKRLRDSESVQRTGEYLVQLCLQNKIIQDQILDAVNPAFPAIVDIARTDLRNRITQREECKKRHAQSLAEASQPSRARR